MIHYIALLVAVLAVTDLLAIAITVGTTKFWTATAARILVLELGVSSLLLTAAIEVLR